MDAIELLVNEHALIRQYLDNLSVAAEKLESGERPPEVFFKKAVEFAKNFTDKFHHFKEEHVLFTQLAQKKRGTFDGQIDSLRHQHEHGRNFITEISSALDGYTKGNDIDTTTLVENLASYISLLRHHIHKEDHDFYQIVKQEFSENELQGFVELFDKEKERVGERTYENSQNIVQEMSVLL
jgi:hemerythrin-like domain-containing protein